MKIYYFMFEAIPKRDNPKRKEYGGAYINCWVKAEKKREALMEAKEYISSEGWFVLLIKDSFIVHRENYEMNNDPESLECYDNAVSDGLCAVFYTWQKRR